MSLVSMLVNSENKLEIIFLHKICLTYILKKLNIYIFTISTFNLRSVKIKIIKPSQIVEQIKTQYSYEEILNHICKKKLKTLYDA